MKYSVLSNNLNKLFFFQVGILTYFAEMTNHLTTIYETISKTNI